MNKLPATVNVAGLTYSIVPNDDYTQGAEAYAVTSHRRLEIRIGVEPPTAVQQVRLALLHELVHTVANSYGGGTGEALSEAWVDALSHGLFQVLRENPGAAAFILEPDGPCEDGSGSPESSNTSELVGRYPQADQLREGVLKELGATARPAARGRSERVRRYRRGGGSNAPAAG